MNCIAYRTATGFCSGESLGESTKLLTICCESLSFHLSQKESYFFSPSSLLRWADAPSLRTWELDAKVSAHANFKGMSTATSNLEVTK